MFPYGSRKIGLNTWELDPTVDEFAVEKEIRLRQRYSNKDDQKMFCGAHGILRNDARVGTLRPLPFRQLCRVPYTSFGYFFGPPNTCSACLFFLEPRLKQLHLQFSDLSNAG